MRKCSRRRHNGTYAKRNGVGSRCLRLVKGLQERSWSGNVEPSDSI